MTKNIQELALAFFLVICGVSILMGVVWLKPLIESQQLLIEETRASQQAIMKGAEETRVILTELGYAAAVTALMEQRIMRPAEANKMIEQSVATIESHSERFGKLARLFNEFRMHEQGRRFER